MAKRSRAPKTPAVPLAPLGVRLLARVIDGAILTALVLPITLLVRSGTVDPVVGLAILVLLPVYELVPTALYGKSLGKWAMGLKVVRLADGGDIGWSHALGRFVVTTALGCVPCVPIDPLYCLWDKPNRQTLHDKAARTVLIADRPRRHGDAVAVFG